MIDARLAAALGTVLSRDLSLATLGLGSLDAIELAVALEDATGLRVPDEAAERFRTLGDVEDFLAAVKPEPG